jgi:hypothetical protein
MIWFVPSTNLHIVLYFLLERAHLTNMIRFKMIRLTLQTQITSMICLLLLSVSTACAEDIESLNPDLKNRAVSQDLQESHMIPTEETSERKIDELTDTTLTENEILSDDQAVSQEDLDYDLKQIPESAAILPYDHTIIQPPISHVQDPMKAVRQIEEFNRFQRQMQQIQELNKRQQELLNLDTSPSSERPNNTNPPLK